MNNSGSSHITALYARRSRRRESVYPSCDAQIDTCRKYALSQRWDCCVPFVDDGKSGETLQRDALKQLLKALRRGEVKRVVVTSLDRLTRKLAHLGQLRDEFAQAEVVLAVVDFPEFNNSPTGRLMANIVGAANEFQIELTKERLADARAALKGREKRVAGRVAFGYQADPNTKALLPHAEQAVVVRDFFKLAADGSKPSELATLANLQGWKNQAGEANRWTARRITKLLSNPIYTGRIHDGAATLPGEHDAIVDQATFEEVQRQLALRQTREPQPGERKAQADRDPPLLRGIVVCGQCDRAMSTSMSQYGSIRYPYYRCRSTAGGKPPCPGVNVQCYELESFICRVLGQPDASDPQEMRGIAKAWNVLHEVTQRKLLPLILDRVIWHQADGEITIDLVDEAPGKIDEVRELENTEEPG